MANLFPITQVLGASGGVNGAAVYFYAAGTLTPQTVYTAQDGATPHSNPVICDASGRFQAWLGTSAYRIRAYSDEIVDGGTLLFDIDNYRAAEDSVASDLSSSASAAGGAGMIGFDPDLAYAAGTLGFYGLMADPRLNLWHYLSAAQIADVRSGTTPTHDCATALAALWAYAKAVGGDVVIPPGNYRTSATWALDITSPVNLRVLGYGATFYATSAVTGAAMQVLGSYNQFSLDIEGLAFNHRNNTTAQGCVEVKGGHNVTLRRCAVEQHNTKAGWYFARFASSSTGSGEDDANSFWCSVRECNTRMRAGGDGTTGDCGVVLEGAVNAFIATDNIFSDVSEAIKVTAAPTTKSLPNALTVERNSFEAVDTTAIALVGTPAELGPTGWRILNNRVETCQTFVSITTGGAAMTAHSQPPLLFGNYCTTGSVTTWINNPTALPLSVLETRQPGYGPSVANSFYQNTGITWVFGAGGGMTLQNASGSGDYSEAWLRQASYYYWTNTSNGKFYLKATAPTNNTDGTVVGTQT